MGRPRKYNVILNEKERQKLARMFRSGTYTATHFRRMRILQSLDRSNPYDDIVADVGCCRATVSKIARVFCTDGFDAVFKDEPRSGRPRKLGPKAESILVELVATEPPEGRARWTLELLTEALDGLEIAESVSAKTVGRALKKTKSAPEP